jgi:alcohol dehydrogenase
MSETVIQKAKCLLQDFKGEDYAFGKNAIAEIGFYAAKLGKKVAIIVGKHAKTSGILDSVIESIEDKGLIVTSILDGARPNAPKEDVYRLAYQLLRSEWDSVIAVGGGSCIDASKAALVLAEYGGVIDDYFGTGKVLKKSHGKKLNLIAVQTASSSAAHLTKYSNITDLVTHQKKLIVDDTIIPKFAVYQYDVSMSAPKSLTKDGALDAFAHCWEVWMGSIGKQAYRKLTDIAHTGIDLVVDNLPKALVDEERYHYREALGLASDLGGYCIMLGGTNAGHLGSFSLVDILSHGRACAILNPYYTVLFSSAIQDQLRRVADIFEDAELINSTRTLGGRNLAKEIAKGMMKFQKSIKFPITLREAGATLTHIKQMLEAARDPQLKMKLQNMPIPMNVNAGDIDRLMKPTLKAAYEGNIDLIPIV